MPQVHCVRCGNQGDAIAEPLFLGRLETQVKANICAPCWAEWVKMRVMVINEYHVNLGDESGRATQQSHFDFAFAVQTRRRDAPAPESIFPNDIRDRPENPGIGKLRSRSEGRRSSLVTQRSKLWPPSTTF